MKYNTATTLNEICGLKLLKSGIDHLLNRLGKTEADNEPLELLTILEINGFDFAKQCLQVPSLAALNRSFVDWCEDQSPKQKPVSLVKSFTAEQKAQEAQLRKMIEVIDG